MGRPPAPGGPVAVTMTGELADLFPDRRAGVKALLATLAAAWPGRELAVWAGARGFVAPEAAVPEEIASANWLATASLAARRMGEGTLVDLGSSYLVIREMNIVPVSRRQMLQVAVVACLPGVPLLFLALPVMDVIRLLLGVVV